jgi:hypothetical protein
MLLTQKQAEGLRLQLLTDLERGETEIEFDQRFIRPIFGSTQELLQWCKRWNITPEFFTRKDMKRRGEVIEWVGFVKPQTDQPVIFIPPDDAL